MPHQFLHDLEFGTCNLPIKLSDSSSQATFAGLVRQILVAKQHDPEANTKTLEDKVDRLVYDMYGLTSAEIGLVEDGV